MYLRTIFSIVIAHLFFFSNAQFGKENRVAQLLIQGKNGEIQRGYLKNLKNDSIHFYALENQILKISSRSLNDISRLKIQHRFGLINGFKYSFIGAEAVLLTYALTQKNDEQSVQTEDFLRNSLYIGLPVGLIGGLSGFTPKLKLDLSDSLSIYQLNTSIVGQKYTHDGQLIIDHRRLHQLQKLKFQDRIQKINSLTYTPKIYFRPYGFTRIKNNISDEVRLKHKSHFQTSYSDIEQTNPFEMGISISPFKRIEFQYTFISLDHKSSGFFDNQNSTYQAGFDFYSKSHAFVALLRPKYFSQSFGKPFQVGIGGGLTYQSLISKGFLSNYETDKSQFDKFQSSDWIPGLQLAGSVDYFLSKNISVRVNGFQSIYRETSIKGLYLSNYPSKSLESIKIKPKSSGLSLSVSFQI